MYVKQALRRLTYIILTLVYFNLLHLFYRNAIYLWQGYRLEELSWLRIIEVHVLLIPILILMPLKFKKPSEILISIFVMILILPSFLIYLNALPYRMYLYTVVIATVIMISITRAPPVKIPPIRHGRYLCLFIATASAILTITLLGNLGGIRNLFRFDYSELYVLREGVTSSAYIGLFAYTIPWTYKVFIPLIIAWSMHTRNYLVFPIAVLAQVSMFFMTTHKLSLAVLAFVLASRFIYRSANPQLLIALGLVLLLGISSFSFFYLENLTVTSLLTQRPLFKPALLNFIYYEFFSQNQLIYFSNSVLSSIMDYPYDSPPGFVIGEYFKGTVTRSNTGFLGSGYAHLGIAGVLIMALAIGLFLWLVDSLGKSEPPWVVACIVFAPMVSVMITADFFPSLATHGLLVAFFLLWLYRKSPGSGKNDSVAR